MTALAKWARFWAVDLHVHTPASADARAEDFGEPGDIVQRALDSGLDAIAITDHNTVAWCTLMAEAARGSNLVVLPGFELSTPQGHLLGIWEEGTPSSTLEDVLIRLGIERDKLGHLDIVASHDMRQCAAEIRARGGLAIAAHIDKERGILTQPVQTHVNQLLADPGLAAFEYVTRETPARVAAKLGDTRAATMIQASDAYDPALSRHAGSGIGRRRTWVKAARPDLRGLRYAFDDPGLRVALTDPSSLPLHPTLDSISIVGGFLNGTRLRFSPDLNCLLGGTGAGKSLVLEAFRFALDQQIDASLFPTIRSEVDRRLHSALGEDSTVQIELSTPGEHFRVTRTYSARGSAPKVERLVVNEWIQVDQAPQALLSLAAFSQGEILEYARQPVGRMGLIDARLDLDDLAEDIARIERSLRLNARDLIAAREQVQTLSVQASAAPELEARERELSALFDGNLVKEQGLWTNERGALTSLADSLASVEFVGPTVPNFPRERMKPGHEAAFERLLAAQQRCNDAVDVAEKLVSSSLSELRAVVEQVRGEVDAEFAQYKGQLDAALEASGGTSLTALRRELEGVQVKLSDARSAAESLASEATPRLVAMERAREKELQELKQLRDRRRTLRREQVDVLNRQMSGFVKIDIPNRGDTNAFRAALDALKVGSRLREPTLNIIADHIHPYSFARALWSGDLSKAGDLPDGVTPADLSRLLTSVADRDLWTQLLDAQILETPDILNVKFRKPEGRDYAKIEDLSHGQKCTAVLVILLADGHTPVLIDQPEDALHAPWIEEYLVDRLREHRGSRQYMFATRSPGLVVSADAEQLITMRASAGRGEVEACGSLERYDLNKLALHHLEGGRTPFDRRTRKLEAALREDAR